MLEIGERLFMKNYSKKISDRLQLISQQMEEKTAICCEGTDCTYGEFIELINKISEEIHRQGIKKDSLIMIKTKRSPLMVASMFAAILNDCAFQLIDTNNNIKRNNYMMKVTRAGCIIESENDSFKIHKIEAETFTYPGIAYVIFTSGSTGKPRGVMISRESLYNTVNSAPVSLYLNCNDVVLAASSVLFDIFILETFVSLCCGCKVVLATDDEYNNPRRLLSLVMQKNVSYVQIVPSKMRMLINLDRDLFSFQHVKKIMLGGERITENLVNTLKEKTCASIYHLYGLTEDTIWTCVCQLTDKEKIFLGDTIEGHKVALLDSDMEVVQKNGKGCIYISGLGLAKGYISEKGIEPLHMVYDQNGNEWFYTGDCALLDEDNRLVFIGRKDYQMKIHGIRVEPEEIESIAKEIDGIDNVVVTAYENQNNDMIMCLFYSSKIDVGQSCIKERLAMMLPNSLLPKHFFKVDDFELLPSGKVNRSSEKLYNIFVSRKKHNKKISSKEKIISYISELCDERKDLIRLDNTFDELEITSILFIRLLIYVENEFNIVIEDERLIASDYKDIEEFIQYIDEQVAYHDEK